MIQRKLKVIEDLFWRRAQVHLAAMTQRFVARYQPDELRAIASFLDSLNNADHDPALAATGAQLLKVWRSEMQPHEWQSFWLLNGLAQSVDSAIDTLSPTQHSGQ